MKINRFIALAVIALLVVSVMGVIRYKVFARPVAAPEMQTQPCDGEDVDRAEAQGAPDSDDIEEQCGDQGENEAEDGNEGGETNEIDEADELPPAQTGITAEQAQAIVELANPGVTTLAVEFDREAGKDIWEVELNNGLDVKVDASSGEILGTEGWD